MMIPENKDDHIAYRLDEIDKKLSNMNEMMTELALFRKDIASINALVTLHESRIDEIEHHDIKTDNRLETLENAKHKMSERLTEHTDQIHKLEIEPTRTKAEKWQQIADYLFKAVIVAIAAIVAAKLGVSI